MGMDILGSDWVFGCGTVFWVECLALAKAFAWEPAGTVAPAPCHQGDCYDAWDGNYRTNDYQEVTDADAHAFAMALYRAIDAMMMESPVKQNQAINVFEEGAIGFNFPQGGGKTISVKRVAELAALTSRGGFVIA
jgi:hypothetical protein